MVFLPPSASRSSLCYSVFEDGPSSTMFLAIPKQLHEQDWKSKVVLDVVTFASVVSSQKHLLMAA